MFEKFRKRFAAARLQEERLYGQVLRELSSGQIRSGLWAKALANCDGSEEKAESLYIRYRVQSIRDEAEIIGSIREDALRQRKLVEAEKEEEKAPYLGDSSRYPKADEIHRENIYSKSKNREPPSFFLYKDSMIKHNSITYWVDGRLFDSAQEAKDFIDSRT